MQQSKQGALNTPAYLMTGQNKASQLIQLSAQLFDSYMLCKWLLNLGSGGKYQLTFLYRLGNVLCYLKTQSQFTTSN